LVCEAVHETPLRFISGDLKRAREKRKKTQEKKKKKNITSCVNPIRNFIILVRAGAAA